MAMNKVSLVGRPTQLPELTYLQDGKPVTRFTLAVARDYKDRDGNRPADFVRCVIWGNDQESNRATNFANYVDQGDLVDVSGRIETRSFEGQDGQTVWITEVNVEEFHFLAKKQDQQEAPPQQTNNRSQGNNRGNNNRSQNNRQTTRR